MVGSTRSLRSARSRANVRSSSEPASLLYPTTSDTRIAASLRVSAMTTLRHESNYHKNAFIPGPSGQKLRATRNVSFRHFCNIKRRANDDRFWSKSGSAKASRSVPLSVIWQRLTPGGQLSEVDRDGVSVHL